MSNLNDVVGAPPAVPLTRLRPAVLPAALPTPRPALRLRRPGCCSGLAALPTLRRLAVAPTRLPACGTKGPE